MHAIDDHKTYMVEDTSDIIYHARWSLVKLLLDRGVAQIEALYALKYRFIVNYGVNIYIYIDYCGIWLLTST